jgi:hypothetical protein
MEKYMEKIVDESLKRICLTGGLVQNGKNHRAKSIEYSLKDYTKLQTNY